MLMTGQIRELAKKREIGVGILVIPSDAEYTEMFLPSVESEIVKYLALNQFK